MQITFGKHSGKSLELLILKEPNYIAWMLKEKSAAGPMKSAQVEAKRLISKFNAKPILKNCEGKPGPLHRATRCTVYGKNVSTPYWWCSKCDPYQSGAIVGKLQSVCSYEDALDHVELWCGGSSADSKNLIKELAQAKGLPARVGESQAKAFFA